MPNHESDEDREKRIEELKHRAEELAGFEMQSGTAEDCPPDIKEGFWKHVVEYEEAPWTTHFQQLERAGVSMPAPDSLNDQEMTAKLWEVINKLAQLLGSVVNFTVFLQKWPKIRHSSPKCCISRSIFTDVASALQGF